MESCILNLILACLVLHDITYDIDIYLMPNLTLSMVKKTSLANKMLFSVPFNPLTAKFFNWNFNPLEVVWVKPQLGFLFLGGNSVFFVLFFFVVHVSKKKKLDRGVGVYGLDNPSFSQIF